MEKRNALIAGATGLVGNALLQQLLNDDQYEKIIVLTRKPLEITNSKIVLLQIDFVNIKAINPGFTVDDVFCALGTTIKTPMLNPVFFTIV